MPELPRYLLMDARARTDWDSATVFECCETLEEARESKDDYGTDTVIWDAVRNCEVTDA